MSIYINENAQGLIFDLDGTLSDSLPLHFKIWKIIGEKYGFTFDPTVMMTMTGMPTIAFAKRIVKENNLRENPEKLITLKQELFFENGHGLRPIQKIVDLVKAYHGKLPMAIGTGASRKSADFQLNTLGLKPYFELIVSADDVSKHKPFPDTFLACAKGMGIAPTHCQVFEDGDLGIQAAKDAGMFITDVRKHIHK